MPKKDGTPTFTEEMFEKLEGKIAELRKAGLTIPEPIKKQAAGNKVSIDPDNKNVTTEFGDFRIPLENRHIIVELDGSGIDLTNLIKYWHDLLNHFNAPPVNGTPITLLYVYTQGKKKDLHSRVVLWRFLKCQIQQNLPVEDGFKAHLYAVHMKDAAQKEQDIGEILDALTACLCELGVK